MRCSSEGKRSPLHVRFGYRCVRLRSVPGAEGRQLWHGTFWKKNADVPMEIITTTPIKSPTQALKALARYLSRWAVEEFFRFCKVSLGIEKVRTLRLWATKQLIQIAYLCSVLLVSLSAPERDQCIIAAGRLKNRPRMLQNQLYALHSGLASILVRSHIQFFRQRRSYLSFMALGP